MEPKSKILMTNPCTVETQREFLYLSTEQEEISFTKDEATQLVVEVLVPFLDAEQLAEIANAIHSQTGGG